MGEKWFLIPELGAENYPETQYPKQLEIPLYQRPDLCFYLDIRNI